MSDASSGIAKPAGVEVTHVHTISAAPKDSFGIPMLPFDSGEIGQGAKDGSSERRLQRSDSKCNMPLFSHFAHN